MATLDDKIFYVDPISITIPNDRQRQNLGPMSEIDELAASIREVGQLQPIIVEQDGESLTLRSGHRRTVACVRIGVKVCCILISDLDEYARAKVEFDENTKRKSLTWAEEDLALKRLYDMAPNQRALATDLGISQGNLSDRVQMARLVEAAPDLSQYKTRSEAKKCARGIVKQERTREALEREMSTGQRIGGGEDESGEPHDLTFLAGTMYLGTFGEDSEPVPDGVADIVVFDPPWGVGIDTFGLDGRIEGTMEDAKERFRENFPVWMTEVVRLMAAHSHLWLFFGMVNYTFVTEVLNTFEDLKYDPVPYIWNKEGTNKTSSYPNFYAARLYESILFVWKGDRPLTMKGLGNVINAPEVSSDEKVHETEKPLLLMDNLLRRSYFPGAVVMDPMFGSGSTFRSTMSLGTTKFFGWEESEHKRDRAVLKAITHGKKLLKLPNFSLYRYDDFINGLPKIGARVLFSTNKQEGLTGTLIDIDNEAQTVSIEPDDPSILVGGLKHIRLGTQAVKGTV